MEVSGKKVTVLGAGKSGTAAALLLRSEGADVFLSELAAIDRDEASRLQEAGIAFEQGSHSTRVHDADFSVVSPGIPPSAPVIRSLLERGVALYSEIEIAFLFCRSRIAGITGTDGKTTTTTLLHRICEEDGRVNGYRAFAAGNIGVPFSSVVKEMDEKDIAVVELSSYQLERCHAFRPEVAVITNVTPDHLDRYGGDINRYAEAKFRIHANQKEGDTLIYNSDDAILSAHFEGGAGKFPFRALAFGIDRVPGIPGVFLQGSAIVSTVSGVREHVIDTSEFLKNSFRGKHNIYNALASVAAAKALGIGNPAINAALGQFQGVEHRQEFVSVIQGVGWVNDSKATNLNAMRQALESLPEKIVLIAGGRDKGNDYSTVADLVSRKVSMIVAIGESRAKITEAFRGIVEVRQATTLQEAVSVSRNAAEAGQTVLFSPGCASFDMFENFEDRGRQFKQCVHHLQPC
ncbi:MAG: UDP-N-acetylmuramoyl-L-alanine--D-glutamate ligase [Chlorobiaceae bacterium]|nr:UDP-N-acetylmuramoyl-L-alanine--D-glutamate ligase [Chlorobiaceae bacterium]NTW10367.1 UDP-N-acetylmuramoyl-L-alanine--D-glutamate ligase [Chlorobiaceae bacterium]